MPSIKPQTTRSINSTTMIGSVVFENAVMDLHFRTIAQMNRSTFAA
jgi:hypothetical protein